MAGVWLAQAFPVYPHGFPPEVIRAFESAIGRKTLGNKPASGTEIIKELGEEHMRTGFPIVYTSGDSVFQIAAHEDVIPVPELYRMCEIARKILDGPNRVGRVIARPFTGAPGSFARTEGRRDFALTPPARSYLQELEDAGVQVHAVGKIDDLFAGVGVSVAHEGATNARALAAVDELLASLDGGLVLANLIETDQLYGHRKDAQGFAGALREIDARVGRMLAALRAEDLLIVTADHGVDLSHPGTDHTREYAPLLAVSGAMLARRAAGGGDLAGARHDGPLADVGASVLRWLTGRDGGGLPGQAFIS